ncbi:MAG: PQQ-binding-like beta-propeller repeat protein [Gemmatimonadota bacterium]|nr:MAG: PQQ-binding-like beta-propeller repeat protein [Gemmatimonadota bacterium]
MSCRRAVTLLGAVLAAAGGADLYSAPPQDRIEPDTPPEAIERLAAREEPPLWRIPLGAVHVDDMRPLGPGRLLVGLKEDKPRLPNQDYLLVDLAAGTVLWRFERKEKGEFEPILALSDIIVFRARERDKYTIVVVDADSGTERWKTSIKGDEVRFYPLPTFDRILVERRDKKRVELTALTLSDGERAWRNEHERDDSERGPPPPTIWMGAVWQFYAGVECIDPEDGTVLWSRTDLVRDLADPPPQVEGESLFLALGHDLVALDIPSGATTWSASLSGYTVVTNIYPYDATIYVRGVANETGRRTSDGRGAFLLSAFRRDDGAFLWSRRTVQPTVSNLVEVDGRLYVATPTSLVAIDAASGEEAFEAEVESTARLYPVQIRAYPDRIAFIGELLVAAYDPVTGDQSYRHGVTPISQETSLSGLDASIPRLQAQLTQLASTLGGSAGPGAGTFAAAEATRYQNLANHYHNQAFSQRQLGDYQGAAMSDLRGQMESDWSGAFSGIAMVASLIELHAQLRRIELQAEMATYEGMLERQELFRRSILAAYAMAQAGDYVFRPSLQWSRGETYIALTLIHLPTGRRRITALSPDYLRYGLWNYVDIERGIVYHHGIGLDPSAYEYSQKHNFEFSGKVRTVNTFLIAAPLRVPR